MVLGVPVQVLALGLDLGLGLDGEALAPEVRGLGLVGDHLALVHQGLAVPVVLEVLHQGLALVQAQGHHRGLLEGRVGLRRLRLAVQELPCLNECGDLR